MAIISHFLDFQHLIYKYHLLCILLTNQTCTSSALILKAPIMTAADDKFCDIFLNFRKIEGMIFHENRLPAEDSHEICHLLFLKKRQNLKL